MTTLDLEIALMKYVNHRVNLVVNNITTMNGYVGFETDMLSVSKSGYATAYELKISKADLKKDLQKNHIKSLGKIIFGKPAIQMYYRNLKYFYYVVPEKLKEQAFEQIPDFAGLIIAKEFEGKPSLREIRKPKQLFNNPYSLQQMYGIARLGAMRILPLKIKLSR